jgi:hypothetical protein
MTTTQSQTADQKHQAWIGLTFLILFAFLFCYSALIAPFWNGNDTWSNILPVIHYRQSILEQHTLPLQTDLWYGGRPQWANPLWNFLYLPSTLVWLLTPLDWGTRLVFFGHLVFSLLAGRMLAGLFLKREVEKSAAAILFMSPILVALTAGHVEKVMSWGWVLLALYFLLNPALSVARRGLYSGICLGIIPLTGSNYYTFYAGLLLLPLVISYRDSRLITYFGLGSLLGLLHLPSVWSMLGQTRAHADTFIDAYSVDLLNSISAISIGYSIPASWEKWTPIGILTLLLFGVILVKKIRIFLSEKRVTISRQEAALLFSIAVLFLFATGLMYRFQNWFNLFRVPSRGLAFVALGIVLYVVMNLEEMIRLSALSKKSARFILLISAVQIMASAWVIRPEGSKYGPYDDAVQHLADVLKTDQAKSVWFSTTELDHMYIDVGLTANHLSLPNVYYGDMGQEIEIKGPYCGYSFDHILAFAPVNGTVIELYANTEWSSTAGKISLDQLSLLEQVTVGDDLINVYRVDCPN